MGHRKRRVFIVEDHVLVSDALAELLGERLTLEVAGAATNRREARRRIVELEPDLVIVDLLLDDGNALELLRFIRDEHPSAISVVLTCLRDVFAAQEAVAAGASGYVLKSQPFEDLVTAIDEVFAGRRYMAPRIAEGMEAARPASPEPPGLGRLSRREREILGLIVGGLTSAEIAGRLNISTKTIDTHRSNMYRKLGLRNTVDLVRFATFRGLDLG
jgi:two-component system response regulator NreC